MSDSSPYRIVVGHDLEPTGDEALTGAIALARRAERAEIHVVHAIKKPSRRGADATSKQLDIAMIELRARASLALPHPVDSITMHLHVRFGDVVGTLQQACVDFDANILVVGTHGLEGLERVRHRSVAEILVRRAPLPVLVARPTNFTGLTPTQRLDPARPGEVIHHDQTMSEVWIPSAHPAHIAGLV